jgi:hypothetical protein
MMYAYYCTIYMLTIDDTELVLNVRKKGFLIRKLNVELVETFGETKWNRKLLLLKTLC